MMGIGKYTMPTSKKIFEEKRFRSLIENSTDAIQLVGPHGDIIYSSDSVEMILGFKAEEIIGVNIQPYIHEEDVSKFFKRWQKLLSEPLARDTLQYRVRHKDGQWVWVESTLTNHLDTAGLNAIVGNFRDISHRIKTEERLKESERQFRMLSDHSPIAITVHGGGKILYLNQTGARMIGAKSIEEVVGQPIARFVHPDFMAAVGKRVRLIMDTGQPTPLFEERFVRLDGEIIDVEVISLPITYDGQKAIQVVIRDITEQKKAEKALRDSEERLRFMAESMPQKMFTTKANGRVDYVNPQWLDYTGMTTKKFLKDGWQEITHPDDRQKAIDSWTRALKTGDAFSCEVRYRRKDGVYRWHLTQAQAMFDKNGKAIRWFGSNTDIDDIRSALKREHSLEKRALRLTEQRTQLIELNKAKDEFIALASHQLRTPATAVKQFLGLILQGFAGELSEPQRKMLTSANDSNDRQIDIINDLLQVARIDGGKVKLNMEEVDIGVLLSRAAEEMRGTVEERRQKIDLSTSSAHFAKVDPIKMRMVLENLLSNASKYSPPGKRIEASIGHDGGYVSVTIKDEGVGIAPQDISKLFKKFSRIDNPLSLIVGGTGLGLYWAQKIVELHGGTIHVESKPGQGSSFIVSIPSA